MERKFKTVTVISAVLIIAVMIGGLALSNVYLNRALKKIDEVQFELDKTMKILHFSQTKIDTMRKELSAYHLSLQDIKGRVEIIDLENRKSQTRFIQKKDSIRNRLDHLYKLYGLGNSAVEITEL